MIRKAELGQLLDSDYPTSDGRPMAETDYHRKLMVEIIETLEAWSANDPMVYVSGNLLIFYEEGNKRRHVAPDVFVVRGVVKTLRPYYQIWREGKGPEVVIELTSKTTKTEDVKKKFALYRDRLGVQEYFLFDPFEDYLTPSMQGFHRIGAEFQAVKPSDGRLPSKILGLHLERNGNQLRLWDPKTKAWMPTPSERLERERAQAKSAAEEAEHAREESRSASAATNAAKAELERVLRENEELRRKLAGGK